MPKVPTSKLTPKQDKFVKGIADGKPDYKAALDAFDIKNPTTSTARSIASEYRTKPNIKEAIDKEMAKQGLTIEKIIAPVTKALESSKKVVTTDGQIIDTGEPDLEMQLKGHDRAVKLMSFGIKKDDGGNTFNFNFGNKSNAKKYINAE